MVNICWTNRAITNCLKICRKFLLRMEQPRNQQRTGVSNLDAPAPPEGDESDTTEDNNAESEGITNEEAGLE